MQSSQIEAAFQKWLPRFDGLWVAKAGDTRYVATRTAAVLPNIYKACWFTLCPLWAGAGTNIKVLESLAFERTCVTTVVGHRGFEDCLRSGDSLLVADSVEELAENCIRLINDQQRRVKLAKWGREVVQREFYYRKFASIVHREVQRVLASNSTATAGAPTP